MLETSSGPGPVFICQIKDPVEFTADKFPSKVLTNTNLITNSLELLKNININLLP